MPSKKDDNAISGDGIVLDYLVKVRTEGKKHALIKLEGNVPLPLFFHKACINQSEITFKKILEAVVVDPLKIQVQTEIRKKQSDLQEVESSRVEEEKKQEDKDIFIIAEKDNKEEPQDDKQPQDNSSDTDKEGEQGDTKKEPTEDKWETPGAVSG